MNYDVLIDEMNGIEEKVVFKHKKFSDVFVKCKDIYNQSGYDKSLEFLSELFKILTI